jgi:hypothetical protein
MTDTRSRFITPAVDRLPLSGGDWIEVRRQLSAGDQFEGYAITFREDGSRAYELLGLAEIYAHLVAWSFTRPGPEGDPIPVEIETGAKKLAALKALDHASYLELDRAIMAHRATWYVEDRKKKAQPSGANGSAPSSSPSTPSGSRSSRSARSSRTSTSGPSSSP